ncbi:MAG: arsenate reductase ArsC [Candidatus Omnitrophica bacterium]|nr:arsenate reductase ArsC [Candidatus Omnitrophota bacterium]
MRILFVCIENAGRSQMAEAFAKEMAPPGCAVFSAGSKPAACVHPIVAEAMLERGIDIRDKKPKGLGDLPVKSFDLAVGMGCGDACPVGLAKKMVSWDIPNPKGLSIESVRPIRDLIEEKVRSLLKELNLLP